MAHIYYSTAALIESEERLFPESKHRSRRIHKKLVKRHGGEFRRVPGCYLCGDTLVIHPALKGQVHAAMEAVAQSFSVRGVTR